MTTVSASPSSITSSGSTTLTAMVTARVPPGFLTGHPGSITFTDSTNSEVLGTVKPGPQCGQHPQPCTFTLNVSGSVMAPGDNTIVAAYSGGPGTQPSSGSTDVFVGTTNTCPGTGECTTSATSSDGMTSTTITSPAQGETVSVFFTNQPPPSSLCPNLGGGETIVYSLSGTVTGTKTVGLKLTGSAAVAEHAVDPNNLGHLCFGSPTTFVSRSGALATQASDGLFYGYLPRCDDGDGDNDNLPGDIIPPAGTLPCVNNVDPVADTWATYDAATQTYTESFTATAGEPKAHG